MITPWVSRNYTLFHRFIPLTTTGAISISVVQHGHIRPADAILSLPEPDRSGAIGTIAVHEIEANPSPYVRAVFVNAARSFAINEAGMQGINGLRTKASPDTMLNLLMLCQLSYLIMMGAAAWGAFKSDILNDRLLGVLIVAVLAQVAIFEIWLQFGERHREFITPLWLILAAAAYQGSRRRPAVPTTNSEL